MSETMRLNASQSPKFGEIWMCNLNPQEGSVQQGYRPVFVLSNNMNNAYSQVINVIPLTSKVYKKHLPMHVYLWDYRKYGLIKPSTMLIEQITTITADRLDRKLGEINDSATLHDIYKAMEIQFPVMRYKTS